MDFGFVFLTEKKSHKANVHMNLGSDRSLFCFVALMEDGVFFLGSLPQVHILFCIA